VNLRINKLAPVVAGGVGGLWAGRKLAESGRWASLIAGVLAFSMSYGQRGFFRDFLQGAAIGILAPGLYAQFFGESAGLPYYRESGAPIVTRDLAARAEAGDLAALGELRARLADLAQRADEVVFPESESGVLDLQFDGDGWGWGSPGTEAGAVHF